MAESHVCITKTFSIKGHQSTQVIQQFHNLALKKTAIKGHQSTQVIQQFHNMALKKTASSTKPWFLGESTFGCRSYHLQELYL
jgi:hypothetical protein